MSFELWKIILGNHGSLYGNPRTGNGVPMNKQDFCKRKYIWVYSRQKDSKLKYNDELYLETGIWFRLTGAYSMSQWVVNTQGYVRFEIRGTWRSEGGVGIAFFRHKSIKILIKAGQ